MDNFLSVLIYLLVSSKTIETKYETIRQVQENTLESPRETDNSRSWRGKISIYGEGYGNCLGCQPHYTEKGELYYVTASGERLNDSLFTLAANFGNLGDMVSVCNLSNSKCVGAKLNDRGPYANDKNGVPRIADLSMAVASALNAETDKSIIEISKVPNQ